MASGGRADFLDGDPRRSGGGQRPDRRGGGGDLRAGGNAFDAAVAAGFAATATEPILASLGGGGFLLARTAAGEEVLVDFFVAMPGRSGQRHDPDAMEAVPIHFGPAVQVFHVGEASVAVPGMLAGLLHVAQRFGRLDLGDLVAPAVGLAEAGVAVDEVFARVLGLVWPILERTEGGQAMFGREGRALRAGERFVCPELAETLAEVAAGRRLSMAPEELGGGIGEADVDGYRVVEREPLRVGVPRRRGGDQPAAIVRRVAGGPWSGGAVGRGPGFGRPARCGGGRRRVEVDGGSSQRAGPGGEQGDHARERCRRRGERGGHVGVERLGVG